MPAGACHEQAGPRYRPLSPAQGKTAKLRVPPQAFCTPPTHPRALPLACQGSLGTSLPLSEPPLSHLSNGFVLLLSDEAMGVQVLCHGQGSVELRRLIIVAPATMEAVTAETVIASEPWAQAAPAPDPQACEG